jgi:hypothetical protein
MRALGRRIAAILRSDSDDRRNGQHNTSGRNKLIDICYHEERVCWVEEE